MAIDTALKRKGATTVGQVWMAPGVTADSTIDDEDRYIASWSFLSSAGVIETVTSATVRRRWNNLPILPIVGLVAAINRHMREFDFRAGAAEHGEIVSSDVNFKMGAYDRTVLMDATSGPLTVELPPCGQTKGLIVTVKKTDSTANAVTIQPCGTATIDGASSHTLSSQYDSATLHSDGSDWWLI